MLLLANTQFREYQGEINSSKNNFELKRMKYLTNLDLVFHRFPNHYYAAINKDSVVIFMSQAKMSCCEVTWVCIGSEVMNFSECVIFTGHDKYAWGQRLGYDVRGKTQSEGHTCPTIELWPFCILEKKKSWFYRIKREGWPQTFKGVFFLIIIIVIFEQFTSFWYACIGLHEHGF